MDRSWWMCFAFICFTESVSCHSENLKTTYQPTWESLDSRPTPGWYDDAKFGIFIHWGVYCVPSFHSEWFWQHWKTQHDENIVEFMNRSYPPGFSYQEFGPEFKAEFFDADKWTDILEGSGAKYVVLTTKHHEGYTLWPSKHSFSWNSVDVGPHRDLVRELSSAIRKNNRMRFGVYYSLFEWYNPLYLRDKSLNYSTQEYVDGVMLPDIKELIETYEPEILWADGAAGAAAEYWKSRDILAWIFNNSTVKDSIAVNDRWGYNTSCKHGGYYTGHDRWDPGTLQSHKWESAITVDRSSWGYRREANLADYLSVKQLIQHLVRTVSCGGNLLMNIGPRKDGIIDPIFQDRLQGMGQWLKINGDAIYKTQPWKHQNDTCNGNVWYTASKEQQYVLYSKEVNGGAKTVYAITLEWPKNNILYVEGLTDHVDGNSTKMFLLGNDESPLKWTKDEKGVWVSFPEMATVTSQWSWCLKITNVAA